MNSSHLLFWCAAFAAISSSEAALIYTESANGELSGSGSAPSVLNFSLGENTVSGLMGRANSLDADIWQFVIAPGQSVTSIRLSQYVPTSSAGSGSFFAIASSSTINTSDGSTHAANKLVNASSNEFLTESVLLGSKLSGGPATLSSPISPGTYTVWFQETATTVNYTLNFILVPEPSASLLALSVVGLLASGRRRRVLP